MTTKTPKTKTRPSAKKFNIGFEVELFIVDKDGKIAHGADKILKRIEKDFPGKHDIVKESAKNVIEVGSAPDPDPVVVMRNLMNELTVLAAAADAEGYQLLPLGSYPGVFTPSIRTDKRYQLRSDVFGKKRFKETGRCCGYHCHYEMPKGVFDSENKMLKKLNDSKHQEYLVHAFNMMVALDPVLATFMQSSPFYQGVPLAKDSRALTWRSSSELEYPKNALGLLPNHGSLPPYVHAGADLIGRVQDNHKEWLDLLERAGVPKKDIPQYTSILEANWSAVKINPHGTIEQRGMDMNRLPILFAVSVLIQTVLQKIQEGHLEVVPHDSAIADPFALEKKKIYIAPDSHVRKELQRAAVFEGLANDTLHRYCRRLVALALELGNKRTALLLKPLTDMLAKRETVSDQIAAQAESMGYKNTKKTLPRAIATDIALTYAQYMKDDMVYIQDLLKKLERE